MANQPEPFGLVAVAVQRMGAWRDGGISSAPTRSAATDGEKKRVAQRLPADGGHRIFHRHHLRFLGIGKDAA